MGITTLLTMLLLFLSPFNLAASPAAAHPTVAGPQTAGLTWHTEVVDSSRAVGTFASLALDSSGHAHIAYYDNGMVSAHPLPPAADSLGSTRLFGWEGRGRGNSSLRRKTYP